MNIFFLRIVDMSLTASWLILAVLILRFILKEAPKWIRVFLWGIVAIRLLCPITIESPFSLIPNFTSNDSVLVKSQADPVDVMDNKYDDLTVQNDVPVSEEFHFIKNVDDNTISENSITPDTGVITVKNKFVLVASVIWKIGMFLLLCYAIISYYRLRNKVRTAVLYVGNIFQSEQVGSPFVLGMVRPKIYLPFGLDEQDIECVIAHENAHIQRKDHWWKPLGFLILVIHWFNPMVWLAYRLLCKDIELACDEKVIKSLGNEQRASYSQALVSCSTNRPTSAICPLAFGEVGVKERVKSIMKYKKPGILLVILAILSCFVLTACFLTDPKEENTSNLETNGEVDDASSLNMGSQDVGILEQNEEIADIIYQLELSTLGKEFRDMDESYKNQLLKEYGPLLEGYSFVARESADGTVAYIIGTYVDDKENNPLNSMGMLERGEGERNYQLIYEIEDEEIMMQEGYKEEGYEIDDSRMVGYSDNEIILIQPVSVKLNLHDAMASYFWKGKDYIPDAVSRGISIHIPSGPYLSLYLISEKYGEISENIPLTEEEAQAILKAEKETLPSGCGLGASLYMDGESEYFTEATGVPKMVINLAVERCGYKFETPENITDAIVEARLDCNWLNEPLYADKEDLERLREILKNAEFGYVGGCGYGTKLTIKLANGAQMIMFKGSDGCDSMVFGSYGGYFIGDEENIEFWELFGLDPETKEIM